MKSARFHAEILFLVCILVLLSAPSIRAQAGKSPPIRLCVREVSLTMLGKEVKAMAITQESGAQGFNPQTSQGFDVEVVNQLKEPTSIHWHGILLPTLMDGVPYVSQEPIPPNGKMAYKFPLKQSGTYWMHSHFGLQEQMLNSAPLILQSEEQKAKADEQYVVLLSDFSFKPPAQILKELKPPIQNMTSTSQITPIPIKTKP